MPIERNLATPVIAGLAVGIAFLALFGIYSSNTHSTQLLENSQSDLYNLNVGSKSYEISYHFQDSDARLLKLTAYPGSNITITIYTPNETTFQMNIPADLGYRVFCTAPRNSCTNSQYQPAVFINDANADYSLNFTSSNDATIKFTVEAGSSAIAIVGTYYP